tara:strand:- start:780 stop:902 length:123 start_codon:yes stop_codon:yes gene_type:complete
MRRALVNARTVILVFARAGAVGEMDLLTGSHARLFETISD